jgi:hypothetical protein
MFFRIILCVILLVSLLSHENDAAKNKKLLAFNTYNTTTTSSAYAHLPSVKRWINSMQHNSGLMESAENTNFVSLYDNALATIFFIQEDERAKAEAILNFYFNRMNEEVLINGGLYQTRTTTGEEAQTLWMGDNAWLLISINHYKKAYGSTKYDVLGARLEKWLRSLQEKDGGLIGGKRANGKEIPKITEGIITAFNAVDGYDDFHRNILKFLKHNRWDSENSLLLAWPENPAYAYAMDVHSLCSVIFPDMSEDVLLEADRFLNQQEMTTTGVLIKGYGFDEDKDVVWLEGTAQMAMAFNEANRPELAKNLLEELDKSIVTASIVKNTKGLPYATNHGSSYGEGALWHHAHTKPALSASIWYVFAKTDFNPLALAKNKMIPKEDKFWILPAIH